VDSTEPPESHPANGERSNGSLGRLAAAVY